MKLDDRTKAVLTNFAQLNKSILFRPGNIISTMTDGMSVLARAQVDEPIEREFAIHDLSRFLGVARLFKDPTIEIGESAVILSENDRRVSYTHSDPQFAPKPPTKELEFTPDAAFKLSQAALREIKDAAAVLGHKEWGIIGEKGSIYVETRDSDNPSSDRYRSRVGDTKKPFSVSLPIDSLRMINADYDVDLAFKGFVRMRAEGLVYYAAVVQKKSMTA